MYVTVMGLWEGTYVWMSCSYFECSECVIKKRDYKIEWKLTELNVLVSVLRKEDSVSKKLLVGVLRIGRRGSQG